MPVFLSSPSIWRSTCHAEIPSPFRRVPHYLSLISFPCPRSSVENQSFLFVTRNDCKRKLYPATTKLSNYSTVYFWVQTTQLLLLHSFRGKFKRSDINSLVALSLVTRFSIQSPISNPRSSFGKYSFFPVSKKTTQKSPFHPALYGSALFFVPQIQIRYFSLGNPPGFLICSSRTNPKSATASLMCPPQGHWGSIINDQQSIANDQQSEISNQQSTICNHQFPEP